MNYEYANRDNQRIDKVSAAIKLVSKRHNDLIIDSRVIKQNVTTGKIEDDYYQMYIKLKLDENKYTAFLFYSSLDILKKEIIFEADIEMHYKWKLEIEVIE